MIKTMANQFKAVIFDLDGTLITEKKQIPGAVETLKRLRKAGIGVFFLTNAGTRTRASVVEKLMSIGFEAHKEEIYSGSYLLARYINKHYRGKSAFTVGEEGLGEELEENGIRLSDSADIVAVCLDRGINYEKLSRAHVLLRKGAVFLATNKDHVYPVEHGTLPGAGAIVAALEFSSERTPYIVGKPNPFAFEIISKEHKIKPKDALVVGDRPDTDVAFAHNAGTKSALVLSGVHKKEDELEFEPDFILNSVNELESVVGI
jgi:HAD superfamily hydrolase (TIGR01450 family)